jgi:hypothetical protein
MRLLETPAQTKYRRDVYLAEMERVWDQEDAEITEHEIRAARNIERIRIHLASIDFYQREHHRTLVTIETLLSVLCILAIGWTIALVFF